MNIIGNKPLRKVASGDRVGTSDHNKIVAAVIDSRNGAFGSQPVPTRDAAIRLFEVISIDSPNSVLNCRNAGALSGDTWAVLLPPIYTELSRPLPGGTVTYVYTSINARTASRAGDTDESQLLTPPILVGEVIKAEWSATNLAYLMQGDGRMWGVDSP